MSLINQLKNLKNSLIEKNKLSPVVIINNPDYKSKIEAFGYESYDRCGDTDKCTITYVAIKYRNMKKWTRCFKRTYGDTDDMMGQGTIDHYDEMIVYKKLRKEEIITILSFIKNDYFAKILFDEYLKNKCESYSNNKRTILSSHEETYGRF